MSDLTDKIAKLLRKAEGKGTTPEEADAFFAKAQALMAEHAISLLTVRAHMAADEKDPLGPLGHDVVNVGSSYYNADALLLQYVANANDCQTRFHKHTKPMHSRLYGYEVDRLNVQMLYTSLLLVVSKQALAFGRESGLRGMPLYVARRSFREAFAQRVNERLKEARRTIIERVDDSLLPALQDKHDTVTRYAGGATTGKGRARSWNYAAAAAGTRAADRADLGGVRIGTNVKGAIG